MIWWAVAIGGCTCLALCIAAVLLDRGDVDAQRLRLLANVSRLTGLPEYRRAVRRHTVAAVTAIILLAVTFGAAVIAAARPTGLPSTAQRTAASQPEDVMLCVGGASTDRAVGAALRYFADRVQTLTSQRIGLTSPDRRVVPLTRDYQWAAAQFRDYTDSSDRPGRAGGTAATVAYVDYAGDVEDVLALCLTGFPSFDRPTAQRRSIIYIGPASLRAAGETRPTLFTTGAVRDLAQKAQVQINVVRTGPGGARLDDLARQTGGQSFSGDSDVAAHLSEVREHPPAQVAAAQESVEITSAETPDVPLALALTALTALVWWPLAVRR
jgi:hypothetical protein